MVVLLAHLIKWYHQPARRGSSWERTNSEQRHPITRRIGKTPSLKASLRDEDWWADVWGDAFGAAWQETQLETLPQQCPWTLEQILDPNWLPDD